MSKKKRVPSRRNPYAATLRKSGAFEKRVVPSRKKKQKRERDKLRRSLKEYR